MIFVDVRRCSVDFHRFPLNYVDVLMRLYNGQRGQVRTDRDSKEFDIQRGTKQGDPISPILFNSVLESIFRVIKRQWITRGHGIRLRQYASQCITNLRFADDVLLIGKLVRSGRDAHRFVSGSREIRSGDAHG